MINGRTRLICLLGDPVSHSNSPAIHNAGFNALGLEYAYMCFRTSVSELGDTIDALKRLNARGFNCTMPLKIAVTDHLDEISEAAELMQAVNTVVISDDGRLSGYNTDGTGYVEAARRQGSDVTGKTITLIGGGGAATAIAVQSAIEKASEINIFTRKGRSSERISSLAGRLNKRTDCIVNPMDIDDDALLRSSLERSDMLINATPVGMAPDIRRTPVPDISMLREGLIVSDIIYEPLETRLVREAKEMGCLAFGGSDMLLNQAAAAFRLWTGMDLPLDRI